MKRFVDGQKQQTHTKFRYWPEDAKTERERSAHRGDGGRSTELRWKRSISVCYGQEDSGQVGRDRIRNFPFRQISGGSVFVDEGFRPWTEAAA